MPTIHLKIISVTLSQDSETEHWKYANRIFFLFSTASNLVTACCALQPSYRLAIRTEGMIEDLVKNLKTTNPDKPANPELQMHCASAIFKVSECFCLA